MNEAFMVERPFLDIFHVNFYEILYTLKIVH